MNDDVPFAFLGRDEPPAPDWPTHSGDFEQFDPFGANASPFDLQFRHNPPIAPPLMEIECPIPHVPLAGFSDLFPPPISAPPPHRPKLALSHKKVPSAAQHPDWLLWNGLPSGSMVQSRHLRQRSLPDSASLRLDSDAEFDHICADPAVVLNPQKLGFIPSQFWSEDAITFGALVKDFFQRKNHANSRFSHKLYCALKITMDDPFYIEFIGIEWITDVVLRIDKRVFARLLAIKTIDGSLFHQQGNFPSHGFFELTEKTAMDFVPIEKTLGVDFDNVRLLVHQDGVFTRACTEADIERCKWVSARKRNLAAIESAE